MRSSLPLAVVGFAVVVGAQHDPFINCMGDSPYISRELIFASPSSDACIRSCRLSGQSDYAYFTASSTYLQGASACYCPKSQNLNSAILEESYTSTVGPGDNTCANAADYQAYRLNVPWLSQGCARGRGSTAPAKQFGNYPLKTCLTLCADYPVVYWQSFQYSSFHSRECLCFDAPFPPPNPSKCSKATIGSDYFVTLQKDFGGPAPSTRRRRRDSQVICSLHSSGLCVSAEQEGSLYCPLGLTACSVPGSGDAYECIDTATELESCGGCVYGEFGKSNGTIGVDCTSLHEQDETNQATCANGVCVSL